MRTLKIVAIVLAVIVGLVVLGLGAVLLFVDPNDYRDDIGRLVEQKTGRPLTIRGKLGLKVFPRIALDIHDVTLGNPPGYGSDPFLSVQQASVGVKLLPLLQKRVEVSRVSVDGLEVTLISRSETQNNWKDLGESEGKPPEKEGGTTAQATIAGVDITKSMLVLRDEKKKTTTRLTDIDAHTGALGGADPVDAQIQFKYDEGAARTVAEVSLKASVQTLDGAKRIEVKNLDASGKWYGSAEKAGAPLDFSAKTPLLAVDLDAQTLAPATLSVKLGELPIQLTAKGEKLLGDYAIEGKLAIERTSARKLMQAFAVEPPVTNDPKVLSVFALTADYHLTPTQARLPSLDLTLDDTQVRGSAAVEDLDAMALRFDLSVNAINLDRYMAPTPEKQAKGAAAEKPPTELPLDTLKTLNAKGQLRIGQAIVSKLAFTDIHIPLEAKDGRAHIGPTQAKLFGGAYNGDIVLDARAARAALTTNEHVRGIDIGALMKAGFDTTRLSGRGDASAQLTAQGNTDIAMFKSLAGKLDFDIRDGAIHGVDLWYEIRRAVALFKRQAFPERAAGTPKTNFDALRGSAVVDNGVLRNDDLTADMTYLKVKGKGTFAIESQAIDYRLTAEVYKLPADAASELQDLKAAEIPVTITGTLADMKVRPDVEGYLKARFKKQVDRKVDEKKEELKQKLNDKLRGILGR